MGGHDCEKCGTSFGSEEALEQHMEDYDHSKLSECPDCGERFGSDELLQDHRKTHRSDLANAVLGINKTYLVAGLVALLGVGALFAFGGSSGSTGGTGAATGSGISLSTDDPVLGDSSASTTIYYFGDYTCPSCRAFEQRSFPRLRQQVIDAGEAMFVKKNFPVITPKSPIPAQASQAVWDQVKDSDPQAFWEWHAHIYDNQGREGSGWASQQNILELTGQIDGIDVEKVRTALNQDTYSGEVQEDLDEGRKQGIRGTPSFIIYNQETGNSVKLVGPQPVSQFRNAIRQVS